MAKSETAKMVRGINDEHAVADGCYFDLKAADRVRKFFAGCLCHSKGEWAGKPFELLDWQWEHFIKPLFGWMRHDGLRRFRRAGLWVPKKNGKSALSSGLSLYMLVADSEPGAEIYNAAADRDQASIVFNEAANMVESSPLLSERLQVIRSTKRITYPKTKSYYKALSAEAPSKEGLNWNFLNFDELHAQKNRDLWETLMYGGKARRQPLNLSISTAGYDRTSIGYEQYEYAKNVIDGTIHDTSFFGLVYEAEPEDDWTSEDVWKKANPSYGITFSRESMVEACTEAKASPVKENAFRRYLLNQWTEQDVRWLTLENWDACGQEIDEADLIGRDCVCGVDLSSTTDLTAAVLCFPPKEDGGEYVFLARIYAPEETLSEKERQAHATYRAWSRKGQLLTTPGSSVDYSFIRRDINELRERFGIQSILIDRWNATQFAQNMRDDGFTVEQFGQGYASMSAPSKLFEQLVIERRINHGGHPVLRWMAANAAIDQDAAGNIKPTKAKSGGKIDGIVASIMALAGASLLPQNQFVAEVW